MTSEYVRTGWEPLKAVLKKRACRSLFPGLILILLSAFPALAGEAVTLFGPQRYELLRGGHNLYSASFDRCEPSAEAFLKVTNGAAKSTRVRAARILLNGTKVAGEHDFKNRVAGFEKALNVERQNDLQIDLKGGHHGYLDRIEALQAGLDNGRQTLGELEALPAEVQAAVANGERLDTEALHKRLQRLAERGERDEHFGEEDDEGEDREDDRLPAWSQAANYRQRLAAVRDNLAALRVLLRQKDEDRERDSREEETGREKQSPESVEARRSTAADRHKQKEERRDDDDRRQEGQGDDSRREHDSHGDSDQKLLKLLDELERLCAATVARLEKLGGRLEVLQARGPAFLIVEVVGQGCDLTPPTISALQPVDGALLANARPRIQASYADDADGAGIDPASVRLTLDGADITAAAIRTDGIDYLPATGLAEGGHNVVLSVADLAGNRSEQSWQFATDTIPPQATITSHTDGAWLNTPSITLAGSLDDATAKVTVNGIAAAVSGSSFSLAGISLSEGANTLEVVATDPAGNSSTTRIALQLDTVAPVVTIAAPQSGLLTNIPRVDLVAGVDEPILSATVNGQAAVIDGLAIRLDAVALSEGANLLTLVVADRAGNPGQAAVSLTLDSIPPLPPLLDPLASPTNQAAVAVSGSAEAGNQVQVVQQRPDGTSTPVGSVQADAGGRFTLGGLTLLEGENRFSASATDAAGNQGSPSAAVAAILDTVPPQPTVSAPADQSFTNQLSCDLAGSADEALASVSIGGVAAQVSGSGFSLSGIALEEGSNTLSVSVTDLAGNSASTSVSLTRDTVAPVVTITAPVAGLLTRLDRVAVAASVDEPILTAAIDGQPAPIDGQTLGLAERLLTEGENRIVVTVSDRAGNPGRAAIFVTRDSTPPQPPLFDPVATPTNQPPVLLQGSAEPFALVEIRRQTTSETLGVVPADDKGRFQLADILLNEGENLFSASATDAAGNTSTDSAELKVVLDTVPPVIAFSAPQDGLFTNAGEIAVAGSVDEPLQSLSVNGQAPTLDGLNFSLAALPLLEGLNQIVASATDLAGNSASAAVSVTRDTVPPTIAIHTPQDGLLTAEATVALSGSVDEPLQTLTLNGQPLDLNSLDFAAAAVPVGEGENQLLLVATDRAGNQGTATLHVQRDSTPPPAPQLLQPVSPTNQANTGIDGSAEPGSSVTLGVLRPDGSSEELATLTAADGSFSLADVALLEGENVFSAVATDAAGNSSAASAPVNVELDTVAPVVTVASPAAGSVSDLLDIQVVGSVDETDAVLAIDGVEVPLDGGTFSHPLTLQPGSNTLILLATDPAGNTGSASVTVQADGTPPTVTIASPASGSLTSQASATLVGSVDEDIVALTLNGQAVPFDGRNFSLPATLIEGENLLTVVATDRAGNIGSASIALVRDSQPPVLQLTGPLEADAGAGIQLQLSVSDASALSLVELRSSAQVVWSGGGEGATSLDRSIPFNLSPELAAGDVVTLRAAAIDAAGNRGETSLSLSVARGASGPGYLQGEIYDDSRGLRLADAVVSVNSAGVEIASAQTDESGGYFFELPAGDYLLRLNKTGFTSVERPVTVQPSLNQQVRDARLTPLAGTPQRFDLAGGLLQRPLGNAADAPQLELDVPADLLADAVDLRLLPLSNQGLPGILPLGWAPLAACRLQAYLPDTTEPDPAAMTALAGSTLRVPLPQTLVLDADARLLLAVYDNDNHLWSAAGSVALSADQTTAQAVLPGGGDFALLLADATAAAPPQEVLGQPLPGSAAVAFDPAAVTAAGRVVPYAAPPRQGLLAAGEVTLSETVSGALLSGTLLIGKVVERFDLNSGETLQPDEYRQDLTFYRAPCITNIGHGVLDPTAAALRTSFPVSPSKEFTVVDLLQGKVGIEILPPQESGSGVLVGPDGARLVDPDGNVLEIPAGALAASVPVQTRTLGSEVAPGADFTLLRAVEIDLTGQPLSASATLAIPAPAGLDPALPLLLVRQIEVAGTAKLKLVGSAKLSGSLAVSATQLPTGAGPLSLPGILASGRYALLQAKAPLAYLRGSVSNPAGTPFAGALVASDTNSLVDLTGADGHYLIPLAVAPFTATAVDPALQDGGSAPGEATTVAQLLALDLSILPVPPQVVGVTPADGSGNVEPNVAPRISFSEPLDRISVTDSTLQLRDSSGQLVAGTLSFNPDGSEVSFYPAASLASEATYTLSVAGTVRDRQGYPLGQPYTSSFTVRDTTPPPMPPAGSIAATFPDVDGLITVSGTQGSVELGATVLVVNDTSGEIVGVQPATNGSFTAKINAQLGDEIQVVMMDAAGNQTLISYLTFKSDDGRYLVTAKGGKVEGEGGSQLVIPDGALLGPAVVKLTQVQEAELPHPVPPEAAYLGAVKIDSSAFPFQKEVKLSIPAPANLPADATFFLAQPKVHQNADGTTEEVYVIIDSAKLIDGRITTASWPFDGIFNIGIFTFLYPVGPIARPGGMVTISGTTYRDMDGIVGYGSSDLPVAGAIIRSPAARSFLAYSDAGGHYASFGFSDSSTCQPFPVIATHPQTMYSDTRSLGSCGVSRVIDNFNFKLADKDTLVADTVAPVVNVSLQAAQGQTARILAGTVPVGTELEVPISIIDQELESATLTVSFKTPDMAAAVPTSVSLVPPMDPELYSARKSETEPALWRYDYQPSFSTPFEGSAPQLFRPQATGTYTFSVEAVDAAGNRSTRSVKVRTLLVGEGPASIDGAPEVDEILPGNGAKEIMVTTPVVVSFSEPVANLTDQTFRLIDRESGEAVPAYIYTSIEGGRMRATLQPVHNLSYGRDYEIVLTRDIADEDGAANVTTNAGNPLPLAQEYRAVFSTKNPKVYDLPAADQFGSGRDIALYTDKNGRSYVVVTARYNGWRVIDITDPTSPQVVFQDPGNSRISYRGVAIDPQSGILAITDGILLSGNNYGYIRFYDLAENPASPKWIGQERIDRSGAGFPGKVVLNGNYAYISSYKLGLQTVDVQAAIERSSNATTGSFNGSTIVSTLDTGIMGYGQPNDIVLYGNRALLTTQSGYLLPLDIQSPGSPRILATFSPAGNQILSAAAVAEYAYTDPDGNSRVMDLAVTSGNGKLNTIDLSNPSSPVVIGTAVDKDGNPVMTYAYNIAISKAAGLAFVPGFGSIQVFDIKDPYHPVLLQTITQLPDAGGNMLSLGWTSGLIEKDGWVYMVNEPAGLRVVDFDPVYLKYYCGDGDFPDVSEAFCSDYYPALNGEKEILLEGLDWAQQPLKAPAQVRITNVEILSDNGTLVERGVNPTKVKVRSHREN